MIDPAEIDLEAVKLKLQQGIGFADIPDLVDRLIAAVEALREHLNQQDTIISTLEGTLKEAGIKHRAAEARVAEMLDGEMTLSRRAEAAEAHAVELAGRAALAAMPTKEPAP